MKLKLFAVLMLLSTTAAAEVKITPYFGFGIYHRDCALSDPMICKNENMGSDTPGTIDAGFRIEPANSNWDIDVGWHHQSYVDRGQLIPGIVEFEGDEAQIDMYGVRFTYLFESLSFTLGE